MGAVSPGRWQPWQFFIRMGATSLLNVTCGDLVILLCAAAASSVARLAVNPKAIAFITLLLLYEQTGRMVRANQDFTKTRPAGQADSHFARNEILFHLRSARNTRL